MANGRCRNEYTRTPAVWRAYHRRTDAFFHIQFRMFTLPSACVPLPTIHMRQCDSHRKRVAVIYQFFSVVFVFIIGQKCDVRMDDTFASSIALSFGIFDRKYASTCPSTSSVGSDDVAMFAARVEIFDVFFFFPRNFVFFLGDSAYVRALSALLSIVQVEVAAKVFKIALIFRCSGAQKRTYTRT